MCVALELWLVDIHIGCFLSFLKTNQRKELLRFGNTYNIYPTCIFGAWSCLFASFACDQSIVQNYQGSIHPDKVSQIWLFCAKELVTGDNGKDSLA